MSVANGAWIIREEGTIWKQNNGLSIQGKVVVITGGHSGIGLETTRVLAGAGASIVIGARDVRKAKDSVSQIKGVEVYELDLAEPASVDDFAEKYRQSFNRCDILINNAGIMATPLLRNSQGYESQFAINHLGHFRLTAGLGVSCRKQKHGWLLFLPLAIGSAGLFLRIPIFFITLTRSGPHMVSQKPPIRSFQFISTGQEALQEFELLRFIRGESFPPT